MARPRLELGTPRFSGVIVAVRGPCLAGHGLDERPARRARRLAHPLKQAGGVSRPVLVADAVLVVPEGAEHQVLMPRVAAAEEADQLELGVIVHGAKPNPRGLRRAALAARPRSARDP